ncbi:MAG: pyrroloquinoline quinone-dependent dehydrogenase [Bryobacterales bacterium]
MNRRTFLASSAASFLAPAAASAVGEDWEWSYYGADQAATRHAPLDQITPDNVGNLEVAWVHHTGDSLERPQTTIEATPIVVDGVLYVTTAQVKTQALDAATGKLLWTFDPFEGSSSRRSRGVSRGVSFWKNGAEVRIFTTAGEFLYCVDGKSGKLVESFADGGALNLSTELDAEITVGFSHTSPVVVWKDLILTGGGGGEGPGPAAPGHIRAWDVRTGKRKWIFHTIPRPGEFGYDTWPQDAWRQAGGANNWAGLALDERRGRLYASLGSAAFDFFGGERKGQDLFGNCVLALNAETGERLWHFQTVHHDLWDYDLPAQPMLCDVVRGGQRIEALVQLTKTGLTFVFDRQTGQPLFGVEERPVPASDVPGEYSWPTQPFPIKPPPLSGLSFDESDLTDVSPQAHAFVKEIFDKHRHGPIFTPPSLEGTIVRPGFLGGALWGGGSFDPGLGYVFVNSSENANIMQLVPAEKDKGYRYGHTGYIRFFDHEQRAPMRPPWGHMTCIDLRTGDFVWREPLGEDPKYGKTGTRQIGGSCATAGGLVFIGATLDERFRAFDSKSGREVWSTQLNAGGYATPCSYAVDGRQYVVIAAGGGGKQRTKSGDEIIAFALPR